MVTSSAPPGLSVLHVFTPVPGGGVESVVAALTLGARGSPVAAQVAAVIPSGQPEYPILAPLRRAGLDVFIINVPRRGYLHERAEFARLCRRLCPDVVHTHGYRADVVDAAMARRLGLPVVSTAHGFTAGDGKNRFYQWLQRRAWRRFDAVVAVSRALRDDLIKSGVPPERLHCVQNAWFPSEPLLDRGAARRTLGIARDDFRVAWVGRLSAEKGPDVLVDAVPQVVDLPLAVSVVGAGPMQPALEARAAALGVADRIHWHGLVPGAGRVLRAFDAFALTSRTEGTPIALLEAMAAELPIVATMVGGVPDVVSAKEALLVPPDDPLAVAQALRDILQNPAAARLRALAARQRLERAFPLAAWLGRYEAVYRAVRRTAA